MSDSSPSQVLSYIGAEEREPLQYVIRLVLFAGLGASVLDFVHICASLVISTRFLRPVHSPFWSFDVGVSVADAAGNFVLAISLLVVVCRDLAWRSIVVSTAIVIGLRLYDCLAPAYYFLRSPNENWSVITTITFHLIYVVPHTTLLLTAVSPVIRRTGVGTAHKAGVGEALSKSTA
ncbi:MAG: hypothetical protein JO353_05130 [Phycisphaerae bacterium]|nr:hypothetical protein [Phycisphaerae bacterium]